MKFLKWCISKEYRPIEVMFLIVAAILLNQGHVELFIVATVIGVTVEVTLQRMLDKRAMDKPWKDLADRGLTIDAIKVHRQIYGSRLKESKDVVVDYINNKTR